MNKGTDIFASFFFIFFLLDFPSDKHQKVQPQKCEIMIMMVDIHDAILPWVLFVRNKALWWKLDCVYYAIR